MNAKRFFLVALAACLLALTFVAVFVAAVDPIFTVNGVAEDETAVFSNERYEMPGLIRHQNYSAVVMGTSMVANFRASWFTEGTGEETLKITFPDGWISEFDRALALAYECRPALKRVFFCLDPNILIRSDSQRTTELPDYLYNQSLLDDGQAYLSADSFVLAAKTALARWQKKSIPLDDAYLMGRDIKYGQEFAVKFYPRPETVSDTKLPADAYRAACDENLAVIERWLTDHPDTEFTIWFPPYSILYWDMKTREGADEAVLEAVEYAVSRLLKHENVSIHCFLIGTARISDLKDYTDHIHCSQEVTRWMAEQMLTGGWRFTEENYEIRLDELREFVANYDYESLFPADS